MTQKEERLKHRRPLSTTEKILKIQELKAQGKTQVQIAKELNISRRTICTYWNTTDKVSKQEAKRKKPECTKLPRSKPAQLANKPAHSRRKLTVSAEEVRALNFMYFS